MGATEGYPSATVLLRLVSEPNARVHWRKQRGKKGLGTTQRTATFAALHNAYLGQKKPELPLRVTIQRLYSTPAHAKAMDSDNLVAACKHVRDEIAKWLGVDDGPKTAIEWVCVQEPTKGLNRVVVSFDRLPAP